MLGSQVIWCGIPFGAITVKGLFLPVQDFTATSAVKIEADEETGWSKVTGRELQECCFSIRAQAVAGADPRTTFHLLDAMKGMSGNIYVTSGVSTSLTTSLLDALQTSDWRNIFSADTAANIIKGLLCGTKIGEVAYMLTAVEMNAQGIASNGDIYDATITLSFTEDVAMRQGGGLAVHINGKDITSSISVQACTYDMSAEGEADCLRLIFSDPTGVWAKWQAKKEGDTARITDGAVDSGSMFIDTLKPKDGAYELVAYSTPRSAFAKRSRSFNALSLPQLASKIASEHKLKVKTFSAPETRVSYTQQRGVGDLAFLHEQCQRAGAAFVVYNGTICLYGQKAMEGRDAARTITPDTQDKFTVTEDSVPSWKWRPSVNLPLGRLSVWSARAGRARRSSTASVMICSPSAATCGCVNPCPTNRHVTQEGNSPELRRHTCGGRAERPTRHRHAPPARAVLLARGHGEPASRGGSLLHGGRRARGRCHLAHGRRVG